jgi:hypothetical protein
LLSGEAHKKRPTPHNQQFVIKTSIYLAIQLDVYTGEHDDVSVAVVDALFIGKRWVVIRARE